MIRPAENYSAKRERPALFYIPQKPYMTVGCLRDQIIYPSQSQTEDCCDEELLKLLEEVDLRSLAEREPNGLDSFGDWDSTLSGGEKQRLAMTRLFYHAPQYALLDECTSAVSLEAEAVIYETAKRKGITLLTITHRVASLAKYHKLLLRFDGEGGWTFGPLEAESATRLTTPATYEQTEQHEVKGGHYRMLHVRSRVFFPHFNTKRTTMLQRACTKCISIFCFCLQELRDIHKEDAKIGIS